MSINFSCQVSVSLFPKLVWILNACFENLLLNSVMYNCLYKCQIERSKQAAFPLALFGDKTEGSICEHVRLHFFHPFVNSM